MNILFAYVRYINNILKIMEKIITIVCALFLTLGSVNAQKVIKDNIDGSAANSENLAKVNEGLDLNSGFGIEYQGIEDGFGMGMNLVINHFVLSGSMYSLDTNGYIETNEGWKLGAGYNHRHWFNKSIYIEGTVGVQYWNHKMEIDGEEDSNGEFGLFVTPRVGLKLFKIWDTDWAINAGYRWDFNKFKFSKDYTSDYFTIGLTAVF